MFGLFRKKKESHVVPLELSPEQDSFLAAAIQEHNQKNQALETEWGFGEFEEWGFDQEDGEFFIRFKGGGLVTALGQIYGSYSISQKSWEWAWNNPNVEESIRKDSQLVREFGEKEGIPYLCTGMLPLANEQIATYFAAVAEKLSGAQGVYPGQSGPFIIFIGLKDLKKVDDGRS